MDKQSSQEHSIGFENDASNRVVRPKLAAMQLQLLPSDVLLDILSRLSLKEVVRTSILSREWRDLRIRHPDLVFTKETFNITIGDNEDLEPMTYNQVAEVNARKLEPLTRQFIKNVNSLLRPLWYTTTSTTSMVNKFAVKFGLRREHRNHIDGWVSFSTSSRAKHIALDFTPEVYDGFDSEEDQYALPLSYLSGPNGSCVKSLHLGSVNLKLPPFFSGITNLKDLTLDTVSISGDDLERLLLSCASLEKLNLEWCSFSSLRIQQELCRLQYLRVRYSKLELQLHSLNLKTFEFDDRVKKVLLNECLKLSEATFVTNMDASDYDKYSLTFIELPDALHNVHQLVLRLNVNQVLRFSDNESPFINLRHMNVNLQIFFFPPDTTWAVGLVNLLKLAPLLEELELHVRHDIPRPSTIRTATAIQGPLHRHLKSVHMTGFCEVLGLAELALYILGNATALKRMVVDPAAYRDPGNDDIYSVSKGGINEEDHSHINQKRKFVEKNLDREEFRHILTIL